MKKRFLALCLALVMVLSLVPVMPLVSNANDIPTVKAYITEEPIVLDGELNEAIWNDTQYHWFAQSGEGAPTSVVRTTLRNGVLYFLVTRPGSVDSNTLTVGLGDKTWTMDLANASFADEGIDAVIGKVYVEIRVDLAALGMEYTAYGQTRTASFVMANDAGSCSITYNIEAYNYLINYPNVENYDVNMAFNRLYVWKASTDIITYHQNWEQNDVYFAVANRERDEVVEYFSYMDVNKDMLYEQVMCIDAMTISNGQYDHFGIDTKYEGYAIVLEQAGPGVFAAILIYKDETGVLQLKVWDGTAGTEATALGVDFGETFTLGLYRKHDGELTVLVNDKPLVSYATTTAGGFHGKNTICQYFYNKNCSTDEATNITITDMDFTVIDAGVTAPVKVDANVVDGGFVKTGVGSFTTVEGGVGAGASFIKQDFNGIGFAAVDFTKDMLLEQVIDITEMPETEGVMTHTAADGLVISIQEKNNSNYPDNPVDDAVTRMAIWTNLYNDIEGDGLKLKVRDYLGGYTVVDMGKNVGEGAFKLGLQYRAYDRSLTVYVDDVAVATIASAYMIQANYNLKGVIYRTDFPEGTAIMDVTNIGLTTTEPDGLTNLLFTNGTIPGGAYNHVTDVNGDFDFKSGAIWQFTPIDAQVNLSNKIEIQFTMDVKDLDATGFNFTIEDVTPFSRYINLNVFAQDGALKLRSRSNLDNVLDLGKTVGGGAFTVKIVGDPSVGMKAYVDGTEIGNLEYAAGNFNGSTKIDMRTYGATADFIFSDVTIKTIAAKYSSLKLETPVLNALTAEAMFPGVDFANLSTNLTFLSAIETETMGLIPVTYTSSNTAVLSNKGVVAPNCVEAGTSTLTVALADGTELYTVDVVVPAAGHALKKVEGAGYTCTDDGHEEHFKCARCGALFLDAEGTQPTDEEAVKIPAAHSYVEHDAVDATEEATGNKKYYTCDNCDLFFDADKNVTTWDEIEIPKVEKPAVVLKPGEILVDGVAQTLYLGATATLGNSLAIDFVIDTSWLSGTGYYVKVTKGYADGTDDKVIIFEQADWETYDGAWKYFSYNGVAAKEMADVFTIEVYNSNDEVVSSWTDSLMAYMQRNAEAELTYDAPNYELVTLFVDALNYGAAAQVNFAYNVNNLANAGLSEELQAYATADSALDNLGNTRQDCDGYQGSYLLLEDKIVLNSVMSYESMVNCAYVEITFVDHYGVAQKETVLASELEEYEGLGWVIAAETMVIADCAIDITMTMYNAEGDAIGFVVDSVSSYVTRMMDENPTLYSNIMKFSIAAYNFFH